MVQELSQQTVKLPSRPKRDPQGNEEMNDRAYMKGESAINYSDLTKPEEAKKKMPWIIIAVILIIVIAVGASYYFFVLHGTP